jgi:hypothetical protein
MDGKCNAIVEMVIHTKFRKQMKGRYLVEDIPVDYRMILKRILRKENEMLRIDHVV